MKYFGATKRIRVSCAYLFRILVRGKYLLVMDEQGRKQYQAVGGAYKYNDELDIRGLFNAIPCNKYKYKDDLDRDLRLLLDRSRLQRFKRWYHSQKNRENINDLYREFQEELIDANVLKDRELFKTIKYRFCGESIEASRYIDTVQIHFADIVEILPTHEQEAALIKLMENPPSNVMFATEEEILKCGITTGSAVQVPTISPHSYKILESHEKTLKHRKRYRGRLFTATRSEKTNSTDYTTLLSSIKEGDPNKEFIIISYQSGNIMSVLKDCQKLQDAGYNIIFDRNKVRDNWTHDILTEFRNSKCKGAIVYVDKNYLNNSSACYVEVKEMNSAKLSHFIILLNMGVDDISDTIQFWIKSNDADKDKLCAFKIFFDYDDNTGGINNSCISATGDMSHLNNLDFERYLRKLFE